MSKFITFLEIHKEQILIISSILFVLLTLIFIFCGYKIETTAIFLCYFVFLNIYCVLFVLFVIYTTTPSTITKSANPVYWLYTTNLTLTCLIVYYLCLLFICSTYWDRDGSIAINSSLILLYLFIKKIPVLIVINLIIGLCANILYLYNYDKSDDTFEFNFFFLSFATTIVNLCFYKLFIFSLTYLEQGIKADTDNNFVILLLFFSLAVFVYVIVLDIINNKKQLSSKYYKVAIALLLTFISALIIFSIYSYFIGRERDNRVSSLPSNSVRSTINSRISYNNSERSSIISRTSYNSERLSNLHLEE
jgi:hypothetical protein